MNLKDIKKSLINLQETIKETDKTKEMKGARDIRKIKEIKEININRIETEDNKTQEIDNKNRE